MNRGPPKPPGTTLPDRASIRAFRAADAEAVIALARELQAHEYRNYHRMKHPDGIGRWYLDALLEDAAAHEGLILVAEHDGTVCGYAAFHASVHADDPDEIAYAYAYVADLAVGEAMRGRGIGRLLMEACEVRARAAGRKWLRLNVLAANDTARRFYGRVGFREHLLTLEKDL